MRARISQLHNTEAEWLKVIFIPKQGEIVVYDPDSNYNYSRIKVGDGQKTIHELPFIMDSVINNFVQNLQFIDIDAGRITENH